MRIGFDAKRAFMNTSGLGNYSRTLIRSMAEKFPEHEYFLFTPGVREHIIWEFPESVKIVQPEGFLGKTFPSLWRSRLISEKIRELKLDLFHGLSNEIPRGLSKEVKKIVTVHDVIFLRHPEWYPFIDRNSYYYKVRHACKHADIVVVVSEQTKKDIQYFFRTDPSKIKVVYQGCEERFARLAEPAELASFKSKHSIPGKYILYVGTVEERKNLLVVLHALDKVKDVSLLVIGRKREYFKTVERFIHEKNLGSRVLFPEGVTDDNLPLFYQAAACFVYPSLYEGFGIPVLEALVSGTPVIASNTSALPEAGGPSSLYFDPNDADGLSEKLNLVLNDESLRKKMIADGKVHAAQFSNEKLADEMMNLYLAG